ncbi:hypothetical protein GWK47_052094 [Chionoecetes opilio]|uniref:Uncharacterized protein n=1 Tax=Chionoecetes opilio TaxID=41210 RepID=A0A8J4Y1P4_CHIOP|nr:hypothetical protein GWK47_052094 [Chionoecetes opilio]
MPRVPPHQLSSPLHGDRVQYRTATPQTEARVDVSARGFLDQRTESVMGHQNLRSNGRLPSQRIHWKLLTKRNGTGKTPELVEIDPKCRPRAASHPWFFHYSCWIGPKAKCFYSRLADVMAERSTSQEPLCSLDEVPSLLPAQSALLCSGVLEYSAPHKHSNFRWLETTRPTV